MLEAQLNRRRHAALVQGDPKRRDVASWRRPIGGARKLAAVIGRSAMVHGYELALMASFAAQAPLQLVGAQRASARSPLPAVQAQTTSRTRPVLLVHGFCGGKSSWSRVARALRERGVTVDTLTYSPFGTSVEGLADRLVVAVDRMLSQTGADKVHLVGHSLGGVVIAQAVADDRLTGLVDTVVTLGSPFGGSPWATLLPFGEIARALREGSPLLHRLAAAPAPNGVRWLAITAARDVIVPGLRSVPAHAPVETTTFGSVGHLGMLVSPQVVEHIIDALPA